MSDDNDEDEFDNLYSERINSYISPSSIFEPEQEKDTSRHGSHLISFALMSVDGIFDKLLRLDITANETCSIQSVLPESSYSDDTFTLQRDHFSTFNWNKSQTLQDFLQMEFLQTSNQHLLPPVELDLTDDVDLCHSFDYHNIITTELLAHPEHIPTAEEVIQELDEIMDEYQLDSGPLNTQLTSLSCVSSSDDSGFSQSFTEIGLMSLSQAQLNCICESAEIHIRDLSTELVHQLALRDELSYYQEELERFLSQLHELQKRLDQRAHISTRSFTLSEKDKPATLWSSFPGLKRNKSTPNTVVPNDSGSLDSAGHLTITIPYHVRDSSSSLLPVESVQAYNRILSAMLNNNPLLHSYLTDYILNIYAPNVTGRPPSLPL